MKKIPTVFAMDRESGLALPEARSGSEWVLKGEGEASVKYDGTAALWREGRLWRRYDRKLNKKAHSRLRQGLDLGEISEHLFKTPPEGFEACEPFPDPVTYHWPGWVPIVPGEPADKFFWEALASNPPLEEGATYELVGPTLALNIYGLASHELWKHGREKVVCTDRSFEGLKAWLTENDGEGLVFQHPDGRQAKVRRKDFGLFWVLDDPRKSHTRRPRTPRP